MNKAFFFHWAWALGSDHLIDHFAALLWMAEHSLRSIGVLPSYVVELYTSPQPGPVDCELHCVDVVRRWTRRAASRAQRDHVIWDFCLTGQGQEVRWGRVRCASWFLWSGAGKLGPGQAWSASDLVTAGFRLHWQDGVPCISDDPALA